MRREDFPVLSQGLSYLDSAASTLKPKQVVEVEADFLTQSYANVHRAVYRLGYNASQKFEQSREICARFIGADPLEFIWTSGATASLNFVAHSYLRHQLECGDNIVMTIQEHHANWLPWWQMAKDVGAECRIVRLTDQDVIDYQQLADFIDEKTKIVTVAHVANVTGAITSLEQVREIVPAGVPLCVDGAQALSHIPVNIKDIGADFYVGSAHKMYGPSGIGFAVVSTEYMKKCKQTQLGGGMVTSVTEKGVHFLDGPQGFEAGTPHISGAIGMAAACQYCEEIGLRNMQAHEASLLAYTLAQMQEFMPECRIMGHKKGVHIGTVSFDMPGIHPHDLATLCDNEDVALRAGHHCAMPLMQFWRLPALTRLSFGCYNSMADVDRFITACLKAKQMLGEVK